MRDNSIKLPTIAQGAKLLPNLKAERGAPYGPRQRAVLDPGACATARAVIAAWPGYEATALRPLPGLARALGLAALAYKDEAGRFGLGSFKALGGAYAGARLLQREVSARLGTAVSLDSVLQGEHAEPVAGITLCCATDGNHGRSVAWGARRFGCRCVIFIHEGVSAGRQAAMEGLGAEVRRVPGTYDDSLRMAQETADREGWFVVSDTAHGGSGEITRNVMEGYSLMADEAQAQWRETLAMAGPPSHLFLQTGVGGMAAAVCAHFWQSQARPRCVLVDPEAAACWYRSLEAGQSVIVGGDLETVMACLSCGEVSQLAWEVLEAGADAVMTVTDAAAEGCMRLLAEGAEGDAPLVAGESAVAGLAGLIAAASDPAMRAQLGLGSDSRVLLFGTEGATDPELYRKIVGKSPEAVAA